MINELRLGNWVQDLSGNIFQVKGITESGVLNDKGEFIECIRPINLDKDQLWIWGFKNIGKQKRKDFYKNGFFLHNRIRGLVISKNRPIIKYVHQLQNAYFNFKNEELI